MAPSPVQIGVFREFQIAAARAKRIVVFRVIQIVASRAVHTVVTRVVLIVVTRASQIDATRLSQTVDTRASQTAVVLEVQEFACEGSWRASIHGSTSVDADRGHGHGHAMIYFHYDRGQNSLLIDSCETDPDDHQTWNWCDCQDSTREANDVWISIGVMKNFAVGFDGGSFGFL